MHCTWLAGTSSSNLSELQRATNLLEGSKLLRPAKGWSRRRICQPVVCALASGKGLLLPGERQSRVRRKMHSAE